MLYFGYGSNLCLKDLTRWCGERGLQMPFTATGRPALLPDHEPVFDIFSRSRGGGVLDVRPRRGHVVWGSLFQVDDAALAVLDKKEGAPFLYERYPARALTTDGMEHGAITYRAAPGKAKPGFVAPTGEYVDVVREGLREHGLDSVAVESAAEGGSASALSGLFVYGSLMSGLPNHALLGGRYEMFLPATAPGVLHDLGPYPGMRLAEQSGQVVFGELYSLIEPESALGPLDRLEDFRGYGQAGSLYRRAVMDVRVRGGRQVAWVYILTEKPPGRVVPDGDWRAAARGL
ncbi:MAG: gamma-glutamylcyclotransferase [Desulfatibacillaceae bacterium]